VLLSLLAVLMAAAVAAAMVAIQAHLHRRRGRRAVGTGIVCLRLTLDALGGCCGQNQRCHLLLPRDQRRAPGRIPGPAAPPTRS
jgi:hypothetical protein